MKKPLVYILVLNWNGKEDTIECINSLKEIDYPNYKIIIIDNGSSDDSVKSFKKKYPNIKIIENKKNLGYAEGNNVGIRYALKNKADYVLILNNDVVVDKNFLTELVKVAESDKKTGIVGPKVYHYGTKIIQTLGIRNIFWNMFFYKRGIGRNKKDNGQFDSFTDMDAVPGCCILIKSNVLNEVGFLDKELFLYYEETDLAVRTKNSGYLIKCATNSNVYHKEGSASKKISGFSKYHSARNSIIFVNRHYGLLKNILFIIEYILVRIPIMLFILFIKNKEFIILKDYLRGVYSGFYYLFTKKIKRY